MSILRNGCVALLNLSVKCHIIVSLYLPGVKSVYKVLVLYLQFISQFPVIHNICIVTHILL